jgi:ribosomal protein L32
VGNHICDCGRTFSDLNGLEVCQSTNHGYLPTRSIDDRKDKKYQEIMTAIMALRKADTGGWLKDCHTVNFDCGQGHIDRQEMAKRLDELYKAAGL